VRCSGCWLGNPGQPAAAVFPLWQQLKKNRGACERLRELIIALYRASQNHRALADNERSRKGHRAAAREAKELRAWFADKMQAFHGEENDSDSTHEQMGFPNGKRATWSPGARRSGVRVRTKQRVGWALFGCRWCTRARSLSTPPFSVHPSFPHSPSSFPPPPPPPLKPHPHHHHSPAPQPTHAEEDARLLELVHRYGASNWTIIASALGGGRNGKSCRLRWFNQLDPRVNKEPFSEEEVR